MRGRVAVLGLGVLLLAGCGEDAPDVSLPAPTISVSPVPASAAGGACELLDYVTIEEIIGVRFDVAAASQHQKTRTCVLQPEEASRPDLSLSLTDTKTDTSVFQELVPSGAKTVKGLGKAAYRHVVAPGKGHGGAVEVGWLTGKGRVLCLRYTLAAGAEKTEAEELAPKLVELAERIEAGSAS